jgi:transposase
VLSLPANVKVYLAPGTTDMRKSYDALEALTRTVLAQDPLSGHVFAFCGRRRDRVKLLFWDGTGFWLFSKRLARGTFAWPGPPPEGARSIEPRGDELSAILSGIDLERSTWKPWWRGPARSAVGSSEMGAGTVSSGTH